MLLRCYEAFSLLHQAGRVLGCQKLLACLLVGIVLSVFPGLAIQNHLDPQKESVGVHFATSRSLASTASPENLPAILGSSPKVEGLRGLEKKNTRSAVLKVEHADQIISRGISILRYARLIDYVGLSEKHHDDVYRSNRAQPHLQSLSHPRSE